MTRLEKQYLSVLLHVCPCWNDICELRPTKGQTDSWGAHTWALAPEEGMKVF